MVGPDISAVGGGDGGGDLVSSPPGSVLSQLNGTKEANFVTVKQEKFSPLPASSSSSSMKAIEEADPSLEETVKRALVRVKEEEMEDEEEDDCVCEMVGGGEENNGSSPPSSSSSVMLAKPMEGLHDTGPPPFLKKTFEMVEDPGTDGIVSWSKNCESFIVWDSHEFSKNLLPKYFKHRNFSSFIRQLNTYGFRKIDPDRWEFANEGFKGGKRHLLKNIKRRSRYNKHHQQGALSGITTTDSVIPKLEAQLENLKSDQDFLRVDIHKLRQQQEDSQNQMSAVEERIGAAECKQLQMFIFFGKATRNPGFIQQLMQKRKQQGELEGDEFFKKRRLLQTQLPENLPDDLDKSHCVEYRNQAQEQLATMQNELTETLPDSLESGPIFEVPMDDEFYTSIYDDMTDVMCATEPQDISSAYNLLSDDLLDDNSVVPNSGNEVNLDVDDSKFYLELGNLIGKPKPWVGYATELVEQAGCI